MNGHGVKHRLLVILSCCLIPVLVVFSVWLPLLAQYHVPGAKISDDLLEASRRSPSEPILEELGRMRFFPREWRDQKELINVAEKLLRGEWAYPGHPVSRITVPFDARDM